MIDRITAVRLIRAALVDARRGDDQMHPSTRAEVLADEIMALTHDPSVSGDAVARAEEIRDHVITVQGELAVLRDTIYDDRLEKAAENLHRTRTLLETFAFADRS